MPRPANVNRAECRWLAAVSLATLLLVEIPYLFAYSHETRGLIFTGMLWSPHDFAQYGAAMREGAGGPSWLVHDRLTGEPHDPTLMYPLYVALGKLAVLLHLEPRLVYHATEIAARAALLVTIYIFFSGIYSSITHRRAAFLLVCFSSGMGVWLLLLDGIWHFIGDRLWVFTPDLTLPDVSTFLVMFSAPHLMLGLALLLLAARAYLASWSRPTLGLRVLAVLIVLGLGLTIPFSLVTLCVVLAVHLATSRFRDGRVHGEAATTAVLMVLACLPFLVGGLLNFGADPFWGVAYGEQNVTPSPPLPFLALGLGPVLALTLFRLPAFLRHSPPERWLVFVWIIVSLGLMYLPLPYQRRFGFGLQPMLGVGAAIGLEWIWRAVPRRRATGSPASRAIQQPNTGWSPGWRMVRHGVVVALFASTLLFYGLTLRAALEPTHPTGHGGAFQPAALKEAASWLGTAMQPVDVVLAAPLTGNYLASVVPGRVFLGHPIATLRYAEKEQAAREFYLARYDEEDRRNFLAANNIRYVVYGPHEQLPGATALAVDQLLLRPVYMSAEVSIYEVVSELSYKSEP